MQWLNFENFYANYLTKNQLLDIDMINNLAREKFGTPPGTINEPKNKSLPKSREKEVISEHDNINSTIKDGVSTLAEKPRSPENIMNLNMNNQGTIRSHSFFRS